jgi:hypothetical protein
MVVGKEKVDVFVLAGLHRWKWRSKAVPRLSWLVIAKNMPRGGSEGWNLGMEGEATRHYWMTFITDRVVTTVRLSNRQ